ncbi:MAG TPA: DoxX family protein [Pseudonocardiaceae bacterium]|nr:DoxX family protein [Pseudonocardiaceae bacterium]
MSSYDDRSKSDEGVFYPNTGGGGANYNAAGRDPAEEAFEPGGGFGGGSSGGFGTSGASGTGGTGASGGFGTGGGGGGGASGGFDAGGFSDLSGGGATSVMSPAGDMGGYGGTGMPSGDQFGGAVRDPDRWHGGADLGLLVLRLVLGGTFVANGLQQLFGLFHGVGRAGFQDFLTAAGYQHVSILVWVAGGSELLAGALVVLGLFTPLGAAGMLGLLANMIVLQWPVGFFGAGGFEFAFVLSAGAFALLFAGPGRVSLDRPTPWYRRPVLNGFLFLIIAAAAAVIVLVVLRHPVPTTSVG